MVARASHHHSPNSELVPLERAIDERWYVRPSEAARLTGLAKSTIFAALYGGELLGHRRGRAWLIPVQELRRWIEGDDCAA